MNRIIKIIISIALALSITLCMPFTAMAAESDLTARYLMKNVPDPGCDSVGGEWTVVGLAQCEYEVPQKYFDKYYMNLESIVKEQKGILSEDSYTEYSRVIIALSAIKKNALDVAGYNLVKPLNDYEKVTEQGLNGAIYALLALDKGGYTGPRKELREYILSKELPGGGWNFRGKGEADPDMTAMAVQALARYRFFKDVKPVIERAMPVLTQKEYESSEAVAQVMTALDSIGIKSEADLEKQLLKFRLPDGSFKHLPEDDEGNIMSTEQALMALSVIEDSQ